MAYPPDATLQVIALAVLSAAGFGAALVTTHSGLKHIATSVIVLGTVALSSRQQVGASVSQRSDLWLPWTSAMLRALAQVLSKAGLALWPNPFAAALIGYTVSSAAVWSTALGGRGKAPAFTRSGAAWFAATGVLNGAAVLLMYHALSAGPVYVVSPIVATYPLFTLMLSAAVLREERHSRHTLVGVGLTVAGVVLLLAR